MQGFKNFLMQGELVVIAVGLVVALAFSTLIKSFTDNIISPLVNAAGGGGDQAEGLGFTLNNQRIDIGTFVGAVIYFIIFMLVIYFVIVVPYRMYQARRGNTVFAEEGPKKECPECLSEDLPVQARKCRHCGSSVPVTA